MNAKEAIRIALEGTKGMCTWYISDLSDADLLVRPVPEANHIAWQLGHLIHAESMLGKEYIPGSAYPELPAGFGPQHEKATSSVNPPKGFGTKAEYIALFNKTRDATLANLAKLSDADLDKPTQGKMAAHAPTVGSMLMLISNHVLMHAGQFTVVRRKLGKPILF